MWMFINNRPIRPRSKISICVSITNEYNRVQHRYECQNTLAPWRSLFAEIEQGDVIEFSLLKYTIALYFYMTMKYTKVCLHDTNISKTLALLNTSVCIVFITFVLLTYVRSTYLLYCLSIVEADAKVGGLAESKHKIGLHWCLFTDSTSDSFIFFSVSDGLNITYVYCVSLKITC